ncbi:MAG TPA: flagellar basal body-associated FliL family protein [Nitrospirae bacterium]|nr:flagellar basal body-associated FliL family protein [Nitrospirota bacterium]
MADEKDDLQEEAAGDTKKKGGSKKLLIIIVAAGIVLGAGGFAGYKLLAGKKGGEDVLEKKVDANTSIFALAPFVLNLSDIGRYLKVTIQFEISDESFQEFVKAKTPQLRDTIITLVSSKSLTSIASPEGKFQLKDELLFRANQVMGLDKDVFKNLYFTEFVMQ